MFSLELWANAIIVGVLMGGFYAALSLGLSISFGMLDIVNLAHTVFIILGAYTVYLVNHYLGLDPVIAGFLLGVVFYFVGVAVYLVYYHAFEKSGAGSLQGLVFFFGLMAVIEVLMSVAFGVEFQTVQTIWIGKSINIGYIGIPLRLLIPFGVGIILTLGYYLFFTKTYLGIVTRGVAQDSSAVRLMGADPIRIKLIAFGLAVASSSVVGALLISISPIEPFLGRVFLGKVFAIVVLAGMGSISGTLLAAIILGVAESLTATLGGPAWAIAVSFAILLLVLAFKPSGLFGRA